MKSEAEVPLPACQAGAQRPATHTRGPIIPGAIPEEAFATLLALTVKVLHDKRRKGGGSPHVRLPRSTTIYLADDVRTYLTSRRVGISLVKQEG